MADSRHDENVATRDHNSSTLFSDLPIVYVIPTHLSVEELQAVEEQLTDGGARLTYDPTEARLLIGAISSNRRAKFELQSRHITTEEINRVHAPRSQILSDGETEGRSTKRRRLSQTLDSSSSNQRNEDGQKPIELSETSEMVSNTPPSSLGNTLLHSQTPQSTPSKKNKVIRSASPDSCNDVVRVIKLQWLQDAAQAPEPPTLDDYTIYLGIIAKEAKLETPKNGLPVSISDLGSTHRTSPALDKDVFRVAVQKAQSDHSTRSSGSKRDFLKHAMKSRFQGRSYVSSTQQQSQGTVNRPSLLHETTSEHDASPEPPAMPRWVRENKIYACERLTPQQSPNKGFIDLLKRIRFARILLLDEIAVRAYSTSIASISAYPVALTSCREILGLPGCNEKIAELFREYRGSGSLTAVEDINSDESLKVLELFYNIWGVGATTAREWYFDRGWRNLDDVVENGWESLTRVQKLGVKFYDDFLLRIPRSEVEYIASVITYYARKIIDDGIESIIVGGYRRGNPGSGDVDVILTHRDEAKTKNLIEPLNLALEHAGWITHILAQHETNSMRGQETLPYISAHKKGGGFDTLDKTFLVWQDPLWPTKAQDLENDPDAKNPNPHRRVDIIVSPWKTIGCAVCGWTSGTTFQRDLRRYAKHRKGWKFDSSGVRARGNGQWIDLEKGTNGERAETWQEAERRVFEGFGLEWREPTERCTG